MPFGKRIKNGLKRRPTTRYRTYRNYDFEVVYGCTSKTRSGSVRDHDWCVWIYEADVILMAIRLNLICTYNKYRFIGVLIQRRSQDVSKGGSQRLLTRLLCRHKGPY